MIGSQKIGSFTVINVKRSINPPVIGHSSSKIIFKLIS